MGYQTQIQAKFAGKVGEPIPEFNSECVARHITLIVNAMLTHHSHPAHPALVHFPIAFNLLAWSLDILYALTTTYVKPDFLTSRFGYPTTLLDITRLSYFLLCAGLITTVPTIMSGQKQLVGMISKNGGPWEKDEAGKQKKTMVPRIKVALSHAAMNWVVFAVNLYSWYVRRGTEATGWNEGKTPAPVNMIISMCLVPLLLVTSKTGATLVYNHGVGLHLGRKKWPETNNMTDARGQQANY